MRQLHTLKLDLDATIARLQEEKRMIRVPPGADQPTAGVPPDSCGWSCGTIAEFRVKGRHLSGSDQGRTDQDRPA